MQVRVGGDLISSNLDDTLHHEPQSQRSHYNSMVAKHLQAESNFKLPQTNFSGPVCSIYAVYSICV